MILYCILTGVSISCFVIVMILYKICLFLCNLLFLSISLACDHMKYLSLAVKVRQFNILIVNYAGEQWKESTVDTTPTLCEFISISCMITG